MRHVLKIVSGCVILGIAFFVFAGCGEFVDGKIDFRDDSCDTAGVILPHHLLVGDYISEVYEELSGCNFSRIILLSPNHFNYGYRNLQSTDNVNDYYGRKLALFEILRLERVSPLVIEPRYFFEEHGVTVHIDFIRKFFPDALYIPITFKKGTPVNQLEAMVDSLMDIGLEESLVIASIDFTHFAGEEYAQVNDYNTINWLSRFSAEGSSHNFYSDLLNLSVSLDKRDREAVAFDSVESLYVFLSLMDRNNSRNFEFLRRTSSALILGDDDFSENTSHIFAKFTK